MTTDRDEGAGPPEGYAPFAIASPYVRALGPTFVATDPVRLALWTTPSAANIAGMTHGGALATLADVGLFVIAGRGALLLDAVTLTLSLSYVAPAPIGRLVVCSGHVVREGRSVLFVDGRITDGEDGDVLMTFASTLKRVRRSAA